jgi:hypothetical protein
LASNLRLRYFLSFEGLFQQPVRAAGGHAMLFAEGHFGESAAMEIIE